jgi:hypothetical protein
MKKFILSLFVLRLVGTAAHAQKVDTLLTKKLPEAPGKEIQVITVNYAPGAGDAIPTGMMHMWSHTFSKGKLRCKFAEAGFSGSAPDRSFTNRLKTFTP